MRKRFFHFKTMAINPYPGLRPFQREESHIFFGRVEQVDQLLAKLHSARFLAVVGVSGCGKSSLVRAGMMAALESGFMADAGPRWEFLEMRPMQPCNKPMENLAQALTTSNLCEENWSSRKDAAAFLAAILRRGPLGLVEVLRECQLPEKTNLLLLADQFEEIFRFRLHGDSNEASAFVNLLLASAQQEELPIYVVVTMRSDFLGDCSAFTGLPEAINDSQFLVPRLTRDQCRAAILGPAAVFGGEVEPRLAHSILNDMGTDPDQLPLMQHALMRVWNLSAAEHSGEGDSITSSEDDSTLIVSDRDIDIILTTESYDAAGGLANALSKHADEAYELLNEEDRRVAEVIFRALSERGPDQRDTRRPVQLSTLAEIAGVSNDRVTNVIEVFRRPDRCFLTPPLGVSLDPDTIVDISHESLVRQWQRMNDWVRAEAESATTYRHVSETASLWKAGKAALWSAPDLDYASAWKNRESPSSAWANRYGGNFEASMQFLDASIQARNKQVRKKRNLIITAFTTFTLLTIVALGVAFHINQLRNEADNAKKYALAQRDEANNQRSISEHALYRSSYVRANWHWERGRVGQTRKFLNMYHVSEKEKDLRGWEWYYLLSMCHQELATLRGHLGSVRCVDWHPNGHFIVSGGDDHVLRLWDPDNKKMISVLRGHTAPVLSVAWSLSGKYLASAGRDRKVIIWDGKSNTIIHSLDGHDDSVNALAWSPNGEQIASAGNDMTVRIWNSSNGKEVVTLGPLEQRIYSLAWGSNGLLAAGLVENKAKLYLNATNVTIWRTSDWTREGEYRLAINDTVKSITWLPNSEILVAAVEGGRVASFNAAQKDISSLFRDNGVVISVACYPDAIHPRIASAGFSQTIRVFNPLTKDMLITLWGHKSTIRSVTWSPDGSKIVSGSDDGDVKIWDATKDYRTSQKRKFSNWVGSVSWHPDGKKIAVAELMPWVTIWDIQTGQQDVVLKDPSAGRIWAASWSPDGTRIATSDPRGVVNIWKLTGGTPECILRGLGGITNPVAWSPDGMKIATITTDKVIIWKWSSQEQICSIPITKYGTFTAIAWSPNGSYVAFPRILKDQVVVTLWDVNTGTAKLNIPTGETQINSLAWNPHSDKLAGGGKYGEICVWDVDSGKECISLRGNEELIPYVAWSPDGRRIATASWDGTIKILDADSGEEVWTFQDDTGRAHTVAWSPNGRCLASGSWGASGENLVCIWDASVGYDLEDSLAFQEDNESQSIMTKMHEEAETKKLIAMNLLKEGEKDLAEKLLFKYFLLCTSGTNNPKLNAISPLVYRYRDYYGKFSVPSNEVPKFKGQKFDGASSFAVVPTIFFDGIAPWTFEVYATTAKLPTKDDLFELVSLAQSGGLGIGNHEGFWSMAVRDEEKGVNPGKFGHYKFAMSKIPICLNQHQHIAGVWSGNELRLYIDGQLQQCVTLDPNAPKRYLHELPLMIGANPQSECVPEGFFNGVMESVRITRAEVYKGESFTPPKELRRLDGTIGLYDFRYEIKDIPPDRPITCCFVPDRSGNGNHAWMANTEYVNAENMEP